MRAERPPDETESADRGDAELVARLRRSPLVLVAVGGSVASGKSTIAAQLARALDAVHVGSDEVGAELRRGGLAAFSLEQERAVYAELLRRADHGLADGRCVVVDGCFALGEERRGARRVAVAHGAPFLFLECRASADALRERLAARDAAEDEPFWEARAADVASHWEPVVELPRDEVGVVHTDAPLEHAALEASRSVRARRERLPLPEAVTFDCWNTLIFESDWTVAHARRVERLRAAAQEAGRSPSSEEAGRAFDAAWNRHMGLWAAGEASGAREIARWGLEYLGIADAHPAFEHLVEVFEEASHSGGVRALDGARETLEALAQAGIPCALVCDTGLTPGRVVRRHLDRLGLLPLLAVQAFSDEVGVPKPDAAIFRAALDALGVPPDKALHVGDLRRTDVAGARDLAMRSVRIRASHDDLSPLPEADFVVDSHAVLRRLLGG